MEGRWERGQGVIHESLEFAKAGQKEQALIVLDNALAEAIQENSRYMGFNFVQSRCRSCSRNGRPSPRNTLVPGLINTAAIEIAHLMPRRQEALPVSAETSSCASGAHGEAQQVASVGSAATRS